MLKIVDIAQVAERIYKPKRILNHTSIKKYGERYKVTLQYSRVAKGVRTCYTAKGTINSNSKFTSSISRARQRVYEIGMCNDFEYFITLTLNPDEHDRYDLESYHKRLRKWLNDYGRRTTGTKIQFVLVPERHKNGAWHMHGLISGLPDWVLSDFVAGLHPQKLIDGGYLNWEDYGEKFGFCSLGKIRSKLAVSAYITKYVTNALAERAKDVGAHLYYCSRGLDRAELVTGGSMGLIKDYDFANDHVAIKWCESLEYAKHITSFETENGRE